MSKKKRKRAKAQPESPFARLYDQNRRWVRRIGIATALIVAAVAFWFLADPLGGGLTAIDPVTGEEVRAGIIDGQPDAEAKRRSPAPNFLLPDHFNGNQAVRLDDFEGKIVYLNFWASWCTFCDAEMADILQIAEDFPDDVVILAINQGESQGTAEKWIRDRNFPEDLPNFIWLLDGDQNVSRKYRVSGLPRSFFLTTVGIVNSVPPGVLEFAAMDELVQNALAASPNLSASE